MPADHSHNSATENCANSTFFPGVKPYKMLKDLLKTSWVPDASLLHLK